MKKSEKRILLLTTFIIAGSSIVYELLISAAETYLMGNSTFFYAIVIGVYMASLGIGAFISKFLNKNLIKTFIIIELTLAVIGGISKLAIFEAYINIPNHIIIMYIFVISIGILSGIEIPLLTRIIENKNNSNKSKLKDTISSVMCFDYIGGLVGSIAFPLVLLPQLGFYATAFLAGLINFAAAIMVIIKFKNKLSDIHNLIAISVIIGIILILGLAFSQKIANSIEDGLYRDQVILDEQSQYQHLVITKHKADTRLYIDGNLQFSSKDEYRYHESLVHIPMSLTQYHKNILILGGGDGLAARELLKYNDVENITIVDLDPEMTNICSTNPNITGINNNSLTNNKVHIKNMDAYQFINDTEEIYDIIIIDLPDPNNDALAKLYSNIFYRGCLKILSNNGIINVQSTSSHSAPHTYWCINKTISSECKNVYPYHVYVPSFGDWGFNLFSKNELNINNIKLNNNINYKYLNYNILKKFFNFSTDDIKDLNLIEINTINKPSIINYYNNDVLNWN